MTIVFHFITTVDYEVFGCGGGSPKACVVDPTQRALAVCQRFGAPMTIFVDTAEFLAMGRSGDTPAAAAANVVERQLVDATNSGHDLQLHLHPQWIGARLTEKGWQVDLGRYRTADLPPSEMVEIIDDGLSWLGRLRRQGGAVADVTAFRAGGWCIQPSATLVETLVRAGIRIDSSVAPGIWNATQLDWYDFRASPAPRSHWPVNGDVTRPADQGTFMEVPISVGRFAWSKRITGIIRQKTAGPAFPDGCIGTYGSMHSRRERLTSRLSKLLTARWAMLDYCRLNESDLMSVVDQRKVWARSEGVRNVPIVAIGHSKDFTRRAEAALSALLESLAQCGDVRFSTYGSWLSAYETEQ